ncbi:hypothetical protein TRAPUB_5026 [Trametes pubescens]|uniref:Uncharacterized protein n=1 Tax=Trametes pubescens TaxID=154538 RepID=A0A1M2V9S4_TRAPU|nr:hypothetical protein TRAPUB_5026 [Trametes pubescens]
MTQLNENPQEKTKASPSASASVSTSDARPPSGVPRATEPSAEPKGLAIALTSDGDGDNGDALVRQRHDLTFTQIKKTIASSNVTDDGLVFHIVVRQVSRKNGPSTQDATGHKTPPPPSASVSVSAPGAKHKSGDEQDCVETRILRSLSPKPW